MSAPFPILHDPRPDDTSLPAFLVSTWRGFLPRAHPPTSLPPDFSALESLLQHMPVKTLNGTPGLLATSSLGGAVHDELPDLTDAVDKYKHDLPLVNALYRDYSFLASAYLLEPCHERFVRGEGYGLGRQVLPKVIARPIARCADICGFKPWMEYAGSYALYNYRLEDPSQGMAYHNLRLIRAFEHGLDPTSSEAGFVLVHVDMVQNTGPLVAGVVTCLESLTAADASSAASRSKFNEGLRGMVGALRKINGAMETMWAKSKPTSYTSFRTFIFGITSQSMFPDGVIYEGVEAYGDKPVSFRGESGANDSIVPLVDNFCQVPMPETPLTEILRDFREYRPSNHRAFLEWVKSSSETLGAKAFALSTDETNPSDELRETRYLWLGLLDNIREFRWRHWCFAREYILKRTSHPTATGGSPIVTWLPNQLGAVLREMGDVYESVKAGVSQANEVADIIDLVGRQQGMLQKEVDKYCAERGVDREGNK